MCAEAQTAAVQHSILSVKSADVIVTAFKPSEDGKARIVCLFNASGQTEKARLAWAKPVPKTILLSNFAEEKVSKITGQIEMATYEIVTLRVSPPNCESRVRPRRNVT